MIIGCPTEIKNQEYRVGITPAAAAEAVSRGHTVLMQALVWALASPMQNTPTLVPALLTPLNKCSRRLK